MTMGRHEEAITKMKNGQELDPLSLIINVAVGWACYSARDTTKPSNNSCELSTWTRTIRSRTGFSACCSGKQGATNLAITEGEKGVKLSGGSPLDARRTGAHLCAGGQEIGSIRDAG